MLAKDDDMKELLMSHDIDVMTLAEVTVVEVHPAKVLSNLYSYLGNYHGKQTSLL